MIAILDIQNRWSSMPLDVAMYVETSALAEVLIDRDEGRPGPYGRFTIHLADNHIPMFVSSIARQELYRVALLRTYRAESRKRWGAEEPLRLLKMDRSFLPQVRALQDDWWDAVKQNPAIEIMEVAQDMAFIDRQQDAMTTLGLDLTDAAHYVAAQSAGITSIMLNDDLFGCRAENMNVYTAFDGLLRVKEGRYFIRDRLLP